MKKIHFIVITMAIMSCVLAGCDTSQIDNNGNKLPTRKVITGEISYDTKTKIVYWDMYCKMTPYLSKDGRYCRYEKGKIVPIEKKWSGM